MVKYSQRGYNFANNPLMHLQHPHECGISKSCPHTMCNIFDEGVLVLVTVFCQKDKSLKFMLNTVAAMYNIKYGNVWCLGGYALRGSGDLKWGKSKCIV